MKEFWIGILAGFAGHFALYDVCKSLPFPDLSAHAAGVIIAYPLARMCYQSKRDFDYAYLVTFLGVGIGTFVGRVLRGLFNHNHT